MKEEIPSSIQREFKIEHITCLSKSVLKSTSRGCPSSSIFQLPYRFELKFVPSAIPLSIDKVKSYFNP